MSQVRGLQIWTVLSVVAVGSTIMALLATSKPAESSVFCMSNSDCGCSVENTDTCDSLPEPGFCNSFASCVCNPGYGGAPLSCCPGNGCSGHGSCQIGGTCSCNPGFTGTDCSQA